MERMYLKETRRVPGILELDCVNAVDAMNGFKSLVPGFPKLLYILRRREWAKRGIGYIVRKGYLGPCFLASFLAWVQISIQRIVPLDFLLELIQVTSAPELLPPCLQLIDALHYVIAIAPWMSIYQQLQSI